MVPENDHPQESRPPKLEDLVELCRQLNARKANYIVIGGMAMIQHGFVRATEDIDLLVETTIENEKAVIESLKTLPDSAASEIKPGEIDQYEVIRVADEIVVDLMKKACGIDFDEASKSILRISIGGVVIPFANIQLLKKMKRSIRPKDQMDLQFLEGLSKTENKK